MNNKHNSGEGSGGRSSSSSSSSSSKKKNSCRPPTINVTLILLLFLTAVILSIMSVINMNRKISTIAGGATTNSIREMRKWKSFIEEEEKEQRQKSTSDINSSNNKINNMVRNNNNVEKKKKEGKIMSTTKMNEEKNKSKKVTDKNNNEENIITAKKNDKTAGTTIELDDEAADDGCGILTVPKNDNDTITTLKKDNRMIRSNIQLPLRPPYYLLQNGLPRSGSTFQAQLLMAIVDLKSSSSNDTSTDGRGSKSHSVVLFGNSPNPHWYQQQRANKALSEGKEKKEKERTNQIYQGTEFFQKIVTHGFLQKSHESVWIKKTLCELEKVEEIMNHNNNNNNNNHIAVFTSVVDVDIDDNKNNNSNSIINSRNNNNMHLMQNYPLQYNKGYIAHTQVMKSTEFQNCSLCEIRNYYQPIFDLSKKEVQILENYMSKYQLLRKCCGTQMSKYNRLRLHGCNVTQYQNDPQQHIYPWCENHNMTHIEMEFNLLLKEHGLHYRSVTGEGGGTGTGNDGDSDGGLKVGECQRVDEKIRQGLDFNGAIYDGSCSLMSVDATQEEFYVRTQKARHDKKMKKKEEIEIARKEKERNRNRNKRNERKK